LKWSISFRTKNVLISQAFPMTNSTNVLGILRGQTFNKAGPNGTGQVSYAFRFLAK
jgi:hypothetical protein